MLLRVEGTSTSGQVQVVAYAFRVLGSRYELLRCSGLLACERGRLYDPCSSFPSPICGDEPNLQCVVQGAGSGTYRCQLIVLPVSD